MDPTEGISSKPPLLRFPIELFFEAGSHLQSFNDLNSLVRTSRFFHGIFNTHLYRRAVAADDIVLDDIVGWVLSRCRLASLTHLLDHGLAVNYTGQFFGAWYDRSKPHSRQYEDTMLDFLCNLEDPEDQEGSAALARLLVQRGAETNSKCGKRRQPPLYWAVYHGNFSLVALLLAHGADASAADIDGDTLLHVACLRHGNNVEMIHLLIAHGADIEARNSYFGDTPLLECSIGHAMSALLEHGADATVHNSAGQTPLHRVWTWAESERHGLARSLLEHGAIVNATDHFGYTPLHSLRLADGDRFFMTKFFLENGADVNAVSNNGLSTLHCAILGLCEEAVVVLLLEYGAIINAIDEIGRTPLHCVFDNYSGDELLITKLLLDNGADVNAVSNDGRSPLHCAILGLYEKAIVTLRLQHGVSMNATDGIGRTPLHCLLDKRSADKLLIAKLLLENGADVNAVSNDGLSILQYALRAEIWANVVGLLLEHGADVSRLDREESQLLSKLVTTDE